MFTILCYTTYERCVVALYGISLLYSGQVGGYLRTWEVEIVRVRAHEYRQ